jgi:hypothetical protein
MNERIEKLAVQAGATLEKGYIELSDGQFMLSDNVDLDKSNMDLEKFAELIVRECIQTIQNESMNSNDEWEYGLRIAQGAIQTHFGVEL